MGQNLVLYARYIDDILIIWAGSDFRLFIAHCHINLECVGLTHQVGNSHLVFLDLELGYNSDLNILSNIHFKPTTGNSYLHEQRGHHPRSICNVPFGQCCTLR